MPLIVQFWLIVTLLSAPEFAFTLPLISAFFAVSRPS
ncbi:putative membrane protein, partial [Escherichia coli CB7326]